MNNSDLETNINTITNELLETKGYICSVDILIKLDYLSQEDHDNWRNGKIGCLEKACKINLSKLKTINQIIRQISKKMSLEPSMTVYNKYGKGPKQRLRFSKSGDENIEKVYSVHYVSKYQINKLKEFNDKTKLITVKKKHHAGNKGQAQCLRRF